MTILLCTPPNIFFAISLFVAVLYTCVDGTLACLVDVCILGWFWPDHPTCICLLFAGYWFMHRNGNAMDTDSDGNDCMDKKESCDENF